MLNTLIGNTLQPIIRNNHSHQLLFKLIRSIETSSSPSLFPNRISRSMNKSGSELSSNGNKKDTLESAGVTATTSISSFSTTTTEAGAISSPKNHNNRDTLSAFHSSATSIKSIRSNSLTMKVHPIRALQDNYMYLLIDESTRQAAAVDPVNASAVASAVADLGVELKAILTTHHHYDHAHGNADMLSMFPDIIIYGGDVRVQALTKAVSDREIIKLGTLSIQCLHTPCHTKGHICYFVTGQPSSLIVNETDSQTNLDIERAVFTGDTLFIAGCGRFFEGSSEQMNKNLNKILGKLPDDTRVYCGHEYTVNNLKFALSVEPQNPDIKLKLEWAQSKVAKREPTIPSTIGEEKRINPFMRLKNAQVRKFTGEVEELEVMTVLRHRKNEFQA